MVNEIKQPQDTTKLSNSPQTTPKAEPKLDPPEKAYDVYFERKQLAIVLEKTNDGRLIIFPSVETKGQPNEWYKIGGNSALFYKYLIAPRLHKKPPAIRPDTDLGYRFKDGVVAVHWRDTFIKNMASIGYNSYKEESGLLIFDLHRHFTVQEIQNYKNREKIDREKIGAILKPTASYPTVYNILLAMAKIIPTKVRKLEDPFRKDFGSDLNRSLATLFKIYVNMANSHLDKTTAKAHFTRTIDDINAILIILNENNLIDVTAQSRLGHLLADLRNNINNIK